MKQALLDFARWCGKTVEESPGEPSSLRIVMTSGLLAVIAVWTYNSIHTGTMVAIPETVLYFVGSLLTAKWLQKGTEARTYTPPQLPPQLPPKSV